MAECFYSSCAADMETLQVINVTPLMYLQRRQTSSLVKFSLRDDVTSAVTLQGQRAASGGVCAFKITPLTPFFPFFNSRGRVAGDRSHLNILDLKAVYLEL